MNFRIFALLAAIAPWPAYAAPLTFDAALRAARSNAPSLKASAIGVDAASAAADAAGRLPDPKASIAVESFPISGPLAFQPSRDDFTWVKLGLSQDFPNPAKRRADIARARSNINVARAETGVEERSVAVGAAVGWINLAYAGKRIVALDEIAARLRRYVNTAPAAVASGAARPAQTLSGRVALATLADRRSEQVAEADRARAELTRWTGDPDPEVTGAMPDISLDSGALQRALERHPTLAVIASQSEQTDAEVALARAGKRPDFGIDVAYQHRDPRFGDYVSAGVSMTLPFFSRHRQDPLIAAAQLQSVRTGVRRDAARRALEFELAAALADHRMHHDQWERARDVLQPLAEQRVALETASFASGRASLADVIDAHVALADTTLTVIDREAAIATDAVRLKMTYLGDDR